MTEATREIILVPCRSRERKRDSRSLSCRINPTATLSIPPWTRNHIPSPSCSDLHSSENIMRAIALALASLSVLVVSAQEVETDDIPTQCRDVCLDTLAIADQCNQDDDDAELNCICNAQSASSTIPNCEACVAQFDEEDNGEASRPRIGLRSNFANHFEKTSATSSPRARSQGQRRSRRQCSRSCPPRRPARPRATMSHRS